MEISEVFLDWSDSSSTAFALTIQEYRAVIRFFKDFFVRRKTHETMAHALDASTRSLLRPRMSKQDLERYRRIRLCEFFVRPDEIIQFDKLQQFCLNQNIPYFKVDNLTDAIAWRGVEFETADISKCRVLVSGHSDYPIDQARFKKSGDDLYRWFSSNANHSDPRLVGIPLGVTNQGSDLLLHPVLGDTKTIESALRRRKGAGVVYQNYDISTYPIERARLHNLANSLSWVTTESPCHTRNGRRRFINQIRDHRFVLCPRGNGVDTHRTWESLYLQAIPIVRRSSVMNQFSTLPILFVNDWDEIRNDKFLKRGFDRIWSLEYDLRPLTVSFWCDKIGNAIDRLSEP